MQILYVDNFRGFMDTYIPFADINFLMGENSTGKTSMLSLLNLLSSSVFWQNPNFNSEDIKLGTYDEIADINSRKKYFKIGIFDTENIFTGSSSYYTSVLLKFKKNDKGLPYVSEFSYIGNDYRVSSIIEERTILFKTKKVDSKPNDINEALNFFKNWIMESDFDDIREGFRKVEFESVFTNPLSLPVVMYFLGVIIEKERGNTNKSSNEDRESKEVSIESFLPCFFQKLCWIGPIRAKPRRTYDNRGITRSSEGDHVPYILTDILKDKNIRSSIELYGLQSRLFESINVIQFGKDVTSPFELDVTLNKKQHKITNVGYGVSQILPFITEALLSEYMWYAIQQPEIHLHPRAQAALGDFIYNVHLSEHKNFAIETHSEYLIDRFRININKNSDKKVNSQVLFFERTDSGNIVTSITIDDKGRYSENQPDAFMDFFIKEEIDLLEVC